ncbi:MerR family transcriptional regulator [Pseudonocardia sp. NPDC049635]|uniref:MerR family transcriptional regulator n=1 Tax=Pseudonocardia sp. NPDC049635 TaxID=3155506 RepID=UPI00340A4CDE
MRISEVAARSGVPATTLRYYEDLGLLRPRRASNGYRVFDTDVLERLRFINAAKQLNLPLEQITSLVRAWDSDPCASVKAQLRPLLDTQLERLDTMIEELSQARHVLTAAAQHLDDLPDRPERCSPECAFLATAAPPPPPVACSLSPAQPARLTAWHEALTGAPTRRVAGGMRIELPVEALAPITALAVAEQRCCPFFTFDLSLRGPRFTLVITTPPEGMPMLDRLFPGDDPAHADLVERQP